MGSNRFTQLHVYIIGLVVMLIVGAGLYFGMLKPVYAQVATAKADLSTQETTSVQVGKKQLTYQLGGAGDKAVKDAKEAVKVEQEEAAHTLAQLRQLDRTKNQVPLPIDLGDGTQEYLLTHTMSNWLNLPRKVVPQMRTFVMQLGRKHGVQVLTDFSAPAPQPVPSTIPHDVIAWNLGKMQASGTFPAVMQWARDFTSAPLLCAVDGLEMSLAGPGGTVTANAELTVYIFPTGKQGVVQYPPVTTSAPPAGSGGGGGFGGNPAGANGPGGFGGGGNGAGG